MTPWKTELAAKWGLALALMRMLVKDLRLPGGSDAMTEGPGAALGPGVGHLDGAVAAGVGACAADLHEDLLAAMDEACGEGEAAGIDLDVGECHDLAGGGRKRPAADVGGAVQLHLDLLAEGAPAL